MMWVFLIGKLFESDNVKKEWFIMWFLEKSLNFRGIIVIIE